MRRNSIALVAAVTLLLAGCSDDAPSAPDGGAQVQDGAGSGGGSGGDAAAGLDDIGVAIADGVTDVIFTWNNADGDATGYQLAYATDDFERVVAFHDEWIAAQSTEWLRTDGPDGSVTWTPLDPTLGGATISVTPDFEESSGRITFVIVTGALA